MRSIATFNYDHPMRTQPLLLAAITLAIFSSLGSASEKPIAQDAQGSGRRVALQAPSPDQSHDRSQSWPPQTLRPKLTLPEQYEIDWLAASPDGHLMVVTVTRLRRSMARRVLGLFTLSSIDDQFRADSVLKIRDQEKGELKTIIRDESVGFFRTIVFSPDGRTLAGSDESWPRRVKLWGIGSGKLLFAVPGYRSTFSPDGSTLAITDMPPSKRCGAKLIDVPTGSLKATLTVGTNPIRGWDDFCSVRIYFSSDGQRVITASSDRDSELWDAKTGQRLAVLSGADYSIYYSYWDGPTEMFSPNGKIAVTCNAEFQYSDVKGSVKLWDAETGALLHTLDESCNPARFSPDGNVLATAMNHRYGRSPGVLVSLWSVATGRLIKSFIEPKGGIRDIVWSPDGQTIAVSGDKLRLWDVATGRLKTTLPVVVEWNWDFGGTVSNWDELFFSPNNRFLIAANKKSMRIIDVRTGVILEKIKKLGLPGFFTPDGAWVTRSMDKKGVSVWKILPH